MIRFRQKQFVSPNLVKKAKIGRFIGDAKWAGSVLPVAALNIAKGVGRAVINPISTIKAGGTVLKNSLLGAKGLVVSDAKQIFSPGSTPSKRVGTVIDVVTDLTPLTAGAVAVKDKMLQVAGKSGKDVVHSISELKYQPIKKIGDWGGVLRASCLGIPGANKFNKLLGGKWVSGKFIGVNKRTVGAGGDELVKSIEGIGRGAESTRKLEDSMRKFERYSTGRRLAKWYDKHIVPKANKIPQGYDKAVNSITKALDENLGGENIKKTFRFPTIGTSPGYRPA